MSDPSRARKNLAVVCVAIAALVAHASALQGGFLWLDHAHIEHGAALVPLADAIDSFVRPFAETGYYRPLMTLSLSVDHALGGHPWVFHATSLLWHAAASTSVAFAAEALGLTFATAIAAGLIFATHPITSLIAGAIAFRSEAMMVLFLMIVVIAHQKQRPLMAALSLGLAALCKETALVFGPLMLVAFELKIVAPRGASSANFSTRRAMWIAESTAWLAAFSLRWAFAPPWRASHPGLTLDNAIGTRLAAITKSFLALVPYGNRTICDAFPVTHITQPAALCGAGILAVLVFIGIRHRGAAVLLLLSVLPILQLVPVMRWWSPHYLYLPLVFVAMLVAERLMRRRRGAAITSVLCCGLAALSFHDGHRYRDDQALWAPEVRVDPFCREGQFYLGERARAAGLFPEAKKRYELSITHNAAHLSYVDIVAALQNLGTVQLELGDISRAFESFSSALKVNRNASRQAELMHNAALAALLLGNAQQALLLAAPTCAQADARRETLLLCAKALYMSGQHDESKTMFLRARAQP